jgi:hypothetical protein
MLPNATEQSSLIAEIKNTFETNLTNCEFDWPKIIASLTNMISSVVVREVHQSRSVPLVYRSDIPTYAIVIGGTSLSRGFTLEGLSVSYFLRNTLFYDTLMQMGRWFGYRDGYEDLCKIYLPESTIDSFAQIILATEDLIDDLNRMRESKMTPKDFGLAVKRHPDSLLQVTARNKQKNTKTIDHEMNLDGRSKETAWLVTNEVISRNNIDLIKKTVHKINQLIKPEKKGGSYCWKNVNKSLILDFLISFVTYGSDNPLNTKMPLEFIKEYVREINLDWDVAVYSGEGDDFSIDENINIKKEKRQLTLKGDHLEVLNRQVSSGSAESIVFDSERAKKLGSRRKDIRKEMPKPLLMLHLLQNINDPKSNSNTFAAFGVSFPGGVDSGKKPVKLQINTVYINNLMSGSEDDDYDD